MEYVDVLIIGAGPAGLAAANSLQDGGLTVTVLDKGPIADGVVRYPYYMKFFSTATNLELCGFPLIVRDEKPTREEYLVYLRRFVTERRIHVLTQHRVTSIDRDPASRQPGFVIRGVNDAAEPFALHSRYVVLATGAYDQPQMLDVPGENLAKVSHYFTEVHPYAMKKVAVVGGRASAAETALLLCRNQAEVTLIHRRPKLEGLKYWIQPDIDNRIASGEIRAYFNARITEIQPKHILVQTESGEIVQIENDYVLAMTGYKPDTTMLEKAGIHYDPDTFRPAADPNTLETNIPGLYVAGVIVSGNISGEIFIENSRHHGELILHAIREKDRALPA
ncbi:MAG: YpdA family putative bacillithiol disulfide reductase [Candidatus Sumerlaeaceae bacterium]|nr:YpdA family putative bacillithiol disulfide reductase [Candidatus Sumerlaeaceae bacterium]